MSPPERVIQQRVDVRRRLRWLAALARGAPVSIVVAIAAPLLGGALLVWQAALLAEVLDRAIIGQEPPAALAKPIVWIAILLAARSILSGVGDVAGSWTADHVKEELRRRLAGHLVDEEADPPADREAGAVAATLVDGVETLHGFFANYLAALVAATLLPIAFAAFVLAASPLAGFLLLVTAPLIPVFMVLVGWDAEAAHRRHRQDFLRLSGFFADRLRGLLTIRLLRRGEAEALAVRAAGQALSTRTLSVLRIAFASSAVLEFFAALGVAGVALYIGMSLLGLLSSQTGGLDFRIGLFCLLMAPEVYNPLRRLAVHYHDRAAALAVAADIEALFGNLPDAGSKGRICPGMAEPARGALSVKTSALFVEVENRETPILRDCYIVVPARAQAAILGASGAGKSTLIEALGRLRPSRGGIALGGIDLHLISEAVFRERVAIVPQRAYLFAGTIADNIRLGREGAHETDVIDAARRAGVCLFSEDLPDGLATAVGEGGLGLSGGEAQRVALARLYLRDPDLILLDEPTAHLDHETEAFVLDGLFAFAAGRTLVISTHSEAVAARMSLQIRVADGTARPTHPAQHRPRLGERLAAA